MTQVKYKLAVERDDHMNIDPLGDWDGTWDEDFAYVIYDKYGYIERRWGGFHTAEQAREAGEKALARMEQADSRREE